MRSVPPRGSGWVMTLPIANCQMPIACLVKSQLAIGNRQLAITRPTCYRMVVLTSWDRSTSVGAETGSTRYRLVVLTSWDRSLR